MNPLAAHPSGVQVLLGVNIDHVATLRNARGGTKPDPVQLAREALEAGANIITFHLREDRRHIRDEDVLRLRSEIAAPLNFEAAINEEILRVIEATAPQHVCLVPERRAEVTTEGGLEVAAQMASVRTATQRLQAQGIRVSLFIDAEPRQVQAAAACGADCVELHTGAYAAAHEQAEPAEREATLQALVAAAALAESLGLRVHAGHGLSRATLWPLLQIQAIRELHIGHALIGEALSGGIGASVRATLRRMIAPQIPEAPQG